jgi:hypothetical protein
MIATLKSFGGEPYLLLREDGFEAPFGDAWRKSKILQRVYYPRWVQDAVNAGNWVEIDSVSVADDGRKNTIVKAKGQRFPHATTADGRKHMIVKGKVVKPYEIVEKIENEVVESRSITYKYNFEEILTNSFDVVTYRDGVEISRTKKKKETSKYCDDLNAAWHEFKLKLGCKPHTSELNHRQTTAALPNWVDRRLIGSQMIERTVPAQLVTLAWDNISPVFINNSFVNEDGEFNYEIKPSERDYKQTVLDVDNATYKVVDAVDVVICNYIESTSSRDGGESEDGMRATYTTSHTGYGRVVLKSGKSIKAVHGVRVANEHDKATAQAQFEAHYYEKDPSCFPEYFKN